MIVIVETMEMEMKVVIVIAGGGKMSDIMKIYMQMRSVRKRLKVNSCTQIQISSTMRSVMHSALLRQVSS